jgi:hypothetical protein
MNKAPIKLMMKVSLLCSPFRVGIADYAKLATDNLGAFEKLMKAYDQIAGLLPRLNRLGDALREKPDFQLTLAVVYSDIMEFHKHAYKFFRRNGQ